MKFVKLPLLISILVHIVVFVSIMWIKLGSEYDIGGKMPVTLLKQKQARLLKRSTPPRSTPALDKSVRQYMPGTAVRLGTANTPSPLIYNETVSSEYIPDIRNIEYNAETATKMGYIGYKDYVKPIATPLKQDNPKSPSMNIKVSDGDKLVDSKLLVLEKPKYQLTSSNRESLRKFLDAVRKKIESNKKYPFSAMNAGIEGRSGVKLTILMNGQIEHVEIIDSSGSDVLDNAALESIRNAAPFPPIPSDIGHDKIEMDIYLVFKLSQLGR